MSFKAVLHNMESSDINTWAQNRIDSGRVNDYLNGGGCFIDHDEISGYLTAAVEPDMRRLKDILDKSLAVETLSPEDTACLLSVRDREHLDLMKEAAGRVKRKVYDNRIVTFAPLYTSNLCVNDCLYCGFRKSNTSAERKKLTFDEIKRETEVLAGQIGHKRLIVVFGEHPETGVDYIAQTLTAIMSVTVKTKRGFGQIRRCNVNAAPMPTEELKVLKDTGIGTFQVFQETYHRPTYRKLHPADTIKGDYLWRLYCMHRAMEAGVDDVGIGALFGLYDWKFEVMGLLYHAIELEKRFGIGPHTISFPRLEPADNTPFSNYSGKKVSDDDFERLVTVIRLAVPYTGMILTARENPALRRRILPLGCTQTDASSHIGIGGYSTMDDRQNGRQQQFILGDTRSLDELVGELARDGCITSFCTAGYRCGRTGKCIMDLLRSGAEGKFCKLNAVITFREWLDDFAGPETAQAGERVIQREIDEIKRQMPNTYPQFIKFYEKTEAGERDLYF